MTRPTVGRDPETGALVFGPAECTCDGIDGCRGDLDPAHPDYCDPCGGQALGVPCLIEGAR